MQIKHEPLFDTAKVVEHYTEKDNVDIKYVCTSDLHASDVPCDIFYRETPHPQFGNRYFGLYYDMVRGHLMITNADVIEEKEFGMVEGDDNQLHYSQSHHDYKAFENGNMIDGGRMYIRSSGGAKVFAIKDGSFCTKEQV